jgi:aspartate/tyrosine/aromatic aminotransferase
MQKVKKIIDQLEKIVREMYNSGTSNGIKIAEELEKECNTLAKIHPEIVAAYRKKCSEFKEWAYKINS